MLTFVFRYTTLMIIITYSTIGQNWFRLLNTTMPFPGKASMDISDEMVKQGYTPTKMFRLADDFFSSLGIPKLPSTFWKDSILEKINDGREMDCQPAA